MIAWIEGALFNVRDGICRSVVSRSIKEKWIRNEKMFQVHSKRYRGRL